MSDAGLAVSRWRPKLRTVVGILALGAIALVMTIAWYTRNTAKSAAEWVPAFADSSGAVLYCGNGYGKGVDNQIPWWEWTLLADGSPDAFADELTDALASNGFERVTVSEGSPIEYGENSTLNNLEHLESIGWATSWVRVDASNAAGISAIARVADAKTMSTCFPKFGHVVTAADPSEADVVAVIMFADPGSCTAQIRYWQMARQRPGTRLAQHMVQLGLLVSRIEVTSTIPNPAPSWGHEASLSGKQ